MNTLGGDENINSEHDLLSKATFTNQEGETVEMDDPDFWRKVRNVCLELVSLDSFEHTTLEHRYSEMKLYRKKRRKLYCWKDVERKRLITMRNLFGPKPWY